MASASPAKRDYERGVLKFRDWLTERTIPAWAEAMNLLDRAAASGQLGPREAIDASYKTGLLWMFDSNYEMALRYFEMCLSINPRASFVHTAMGAVNLALGECGKSEWHYRQAIALGEHPAIGYVGVGRALLEAGNAEEAIEWFTKNPSWRQHADSLVWKGNAHRRAGEVDRAIESYEAALAVNETDADVCQALAETNLEDKAHPAAALAWFDRMYGLPESSTAKRLCRTRTPFAAYFSERFPRGETRVAAFEALCALRRAVIDVKEGLCCEGPWAAVHYTALDTSKALIADRSPLRAHRADKMNDPREGGILRSVVGEDLFEGFLDVDGEEESASAFVASFVTRSAPSAPAVTPADDNLLHWRLYGKSGEVEGSGACVVYPCTLFSQRSESHETASLYHSNGVFASPSVIRHVPRWQARTPRLYRVVYEGAGAEEAAADIRSHLRRIRALRRAFVTE